MRTSAGTAVSTVGSVLFLAALLRAYVPKSFRAINTYYTSGALNPLFAGALAVVVVLVFATDATESLSSALGAGLLLVFAAAIVLIAAAWALSVRLDVFLARGWVYPAHRWVLLGLSVLVFLGAVWHAWTIDLLSHGQDPPSPG